MIKIGEVFMGNQKRKYALETQNKEGYSEITQKEW